MNGIIFIIIMGQMLAIIVLALINIQLNARIEKYMEAGRLNRGPSAAKKSDNERRV